MFRLERGIVIEEYFGLKNCIRNALISSISRVLSIDEDTVAGYFRELKLKIVRPPSPELGDYGVALHFLFHKHRIPRNEWSSIAGKIIEEINRLGYGNQCFISRISFINGYLNIYVDYPRYARILLENILTGRIDKELGEIGGHKKIIVEHTSANPIHPLHIGSGRNAVIGSTYANLLRFLGYDVREHFYVDDMGRQVAVLVYGVKILREHGIEPPEKLKKDHWYGIVYALTNILVEEKKLSRKLYRLEEELLESLQRIKEELERRNAGGLAPIYKLIARINNVLSKKSYVHRLWEELGKLDKELEKTIEELGADTEEARNLEKIFKEYHGKYMEFRESVEELLDYASSKAKLSLLDPVVYEVLSSEIKSPEEAEKQIQELMIRYEEGDPEVSMLFRRVAEDVLEGFRETLSRINVSFDEYDWESSREIRELTQKVIGEAVKLPYTVVEGKAVILDLSRAAREHEYVRRIFGDEDPGQFVLRRSDGTTLYGTRDVAYSIYKFTRTGAVRVYNVIAHEQVREQKQVRATLYLLGYRDMADSLVHLDYEMVQLRGFSMSSRRGRYYTVDELVEDYKELVLKEYLDNQVRRTGSPRLEGIDWKGLLGSAEKLAVANTRALLVSIDPRKVLVFDPRKLREHLEGSWLIYTVVRLQGILRKQYGVEPLDHLDEVKNQIIGLLHTTSIEELDRDEKEIIDKLSTYPEVLVDAAESMEPNKLLEYMVDLANTINKFYETHPVLREKDPARRNLRLAVIAAALQVMINLLNILGIPVLKKL